MDLQDIQRMVSGHLTTDACRLLSDLVEAMPEAGSVLDLYCGTGLSTVILASAMDYYGKNTATVISVDTHVTDPLSATPHVDGTIISYLKNLRSFRVLHRVTTMVASTSMVGKVLNKRSVNLVVLQVPSLDAMAADILLAQEVIRNGGKIAVCYPTPTLPPEFAERVSTCFLSKDFKHVVSLPTVQVYQYNIKKEQR